MARFWICETYYVAHIHTDTYRNWGCRKAWADFVLKNENIIDELIMFKPGSGTAISNGICHGIIARCGKCYTIIPDRITNRCSTIHLHSRSMNKVEDYKEILESAHNQRDDESFQKMKKGLESYWNMESVSNDYLSASETDDQIGGDSCCILI